MTDFYVPDLALHLLHHGADCAIGISGGKDSQALLSTFVPWFRNQGYGGRLFAIFADLGRAEWVQTPTFVQQLCVQQQVELVTVQRARGDLLDRIDERMLAMADDTAPFWPSSATRYCTSDLKRSPIDMYLRRSHLVISLEGIRAAESDARASKSPFALRPTITGKRYRQGSLDAAWQHVRHDLQSYRNQPQQHSLFTEQQANVPPQQLPRFACNWYPLFSWSTTDVWKACGTSQEELQERRQYYQTGVKQEDAGLRQRALTGWPAHPAYVLGANRLSCSLCVLGDGPTLLAGARHNPDYYRALCLREAQTGWSFQAGRWLCDVAPELLTEEIRTLLNHHPRRLRWLEQQQTRPHRRMVLPMLAQ